jgi:molybdenum cofactor cytidylyltransferase
MGQPKLLLPWGDWTVIDQLLFAWLSSDVDQIVVVVREDDEDLKAACGHWPVHLVKPVDAPRDMKESVQIGMTFLENHWQPSKDDRCFIAPADLPGLTSDVINRLIETDAGTSTAVIPRFGDRQGHPILLPWPVLQQISDLSDAQGVNQIVDQNPQHVVAFSADEYFQDIDTPEEYRALLNEQNTQEKE